MSKIITDENQLNTEIEDLITEDYALEILGLKNPADFRKFSRSFMKLSKIVKKISDETDTKFKNYCPVSVGSIDVRYDNKNPAELYPSTTWELLTSDKYIRTGNTPLSTGGNNSVSISKANLPNVKLKVDSVSATIKNHYHFIAYGARNDGAENLTNTNYLIKEYAKGAYTDSFLKGVSNVANVGKTSDSGSGSTSSMSPSTESLGSGTALSIQPSYITLKFWKRLT